MERRLKDDKLLETAEKLRHRVTDRFPGAGLSEVATELVQVTREAVARATRISEPNLWVRGGLILVGVLTAVGLIRYFVLSPDLRTASREFVEFLDYSKGAGIYLITAAIFFVTLEIRLKRRNALRAVHELRAMAHLIDMHQLRKTPERIGAADGPVMDDGRPMTVDEVRRYLHFCSELLAIVSKIGQLYVQNLPDPQSMAAVDSCEQLATGLSSKIWQKIMLLERLSEANVAGDKTSAPQPEPQLP